MKEKIKMFFSKFSHIQREKRKSILVAVCLVVALLIVSFFTPIYNVDEIVVVGNNAIPAEVAKNATGIKLGQSIFQVNLADVKKRLSKVAFVDSVKVKMVLPNKIKLVISEREECAYISFIGNYIGIDNTGKILEVKQKLSDVTKPVVYGLSIDSFEIGSSIYTGNEKGKTILFEILGQLETNGIENSIKSIDVHEYDNLRLTLERDIQVKLGDIDNIKYKIAYLKSIIGEIKDVKGGVIDLTDTENVTYRAR